MALNLCSEPRSNFSGIAGSTLIETRATSVEADAVIIFVRLPEESVIGDPVNPVKKRRPAISDKDVIIHLNIDFPFIITSLSI